MAQLSDNAKIFMSLTPQQRMEAMKKVNWRPQPGKVARALKTTAQVGTMAAGAGIIGLGAYRMHQRAQKEKKNPKFWFSRLRKAHHRLGAEIDRGLIREFSRGPQGQKFGGYPRSKYTREYRKSLKKHERRLRELSR